MPLLVRNFLASRVLSRRVTSDATDKKSAASLQLMGQELCYQIALRRLESHRRLVDMCDWRVTVAVGTTIADRPPRRTVRARLRIRLLPRISSGKAGIRIGMLLAAHRAVPGTCVSRSESGACEIERCSPWSAPFPPQPPRKNRPSVFGWFTGTTAQSDFSCTCTSAVRFMAFADRS